MIDRHRDRLLAVLAAVFAVQVVAAARAIEDSLLADAVGAGGVPQAVGAAMLLVALALFAKSFVSASAPRHANPASPANPDNPASPASPAKPWREPLLRTVALVLILIGYGWLLPRLGYALSVSLLVAAVGALAGAAWRWPLWLCSAAAGPALWAMFDWALKVRMPVGNLWN